MKLKPKSNLSTDIKSVYGDLLFGTDPSANAYDQGEYEVILEEYPLFPDSLICTAYTDDPNENLGSITPKHFIWKNERIEKPKCFQIIVRQTSSWIYLYIRHDNPDNPVNLKGAVPILFYLGSVRISGYYAFEGTNSFGDRETCYICNVHYGDVVKFMDHWRSLVGTPTRLVLEVSY